MARKRTRLVMPKNLIKLILSGALLAVLSACTPQAETGYNGHTSVGSGTHKVSQASKDNLKGKITESSMEEIKSGLLVNMMFELTKLDGQDNVWLVESIDKHIDKKVKTRKDPEVIVEMWGNAPTVFSEIYLSGQAVADILQELPNNNDGFFIDKKNGEQIFIKIQSEEAGAKFDQWTKSKNKDIRIWNIPQFVVKSQIGDAVETSNTAMAQICKSKDKAKKIINAKSYLVKLELEVAPDSKIKLKANKIIAEAEICEGLFAKSQHAIGRDIIIRKLILDN